MTAARAPESSGADRFLNRELSWLDFNGRILDLAEDAQLPILERVKFCAICSSHLDEFFMVRVAGLTGQAASGAAVRSVDGLTPHAALAVIRERTLELIARQSSLWTDQLQPALADHGILVGRIEDCTDEELAELGRRFEREVFPVLTPLAVSPGQPFPYISPLSLSLGILVRDPKTAEERFARVKVPELLPRFVTLDGRTLLLPLEHVIRHFLAWLFPRMEVIECAAFRVTRDADFEVSDEADDLLEAVELELRRRRFGGVVRLETSASMSSHMLGQLRRGLGVTADQVYPVSGLLDLADLSEIAELDFPELREAPWLPITQPKLSSVAGTSDFFAEIARQDILVHHPYESFTTSFEAFVRAAAADPDVVGLKTTVYRTGDESPLVPALIEAAEDGKQSVCLIELKARGDESRNIEWSRALERAGVHVSYGFPNRKIHAKATLVVRREGDALRRYVHLGTGNYNAATARIYEDFGLFTADEDIASDVADLFNYLTGFGSPRRFRKLWIAPFTLRERAHRRDPRGGGGGCWRPSGPHQAQGQRTYGRGDHRRALRRVSGGRRDRHRHPQHLLAPARRSRFEREHPGTQHRRALPRAQPRVHPGDRRSRHLRHDQRRSHAAQPRSSARDRRSGGASGAAAAAQRRARRPACRQQPGVETRRGRNVGTPSPREEGRSARQPGHAHEEGSHPSTPANRYQTRTLSTLAMLRVVRPTPSAELGP